jgi:hypothetical protein
MVKAGRAVASWGGVVPWKRITTAEEDALREAARKEGFVLLP